jgi:hypothetical protein
MRGGHLHCEILVPPVAAVLRARCGAVILEHSVPGGFVDILAIHRLGVIVVEIELTPARVHRDLAKAGAVNAAFLFIVTPDARIARACRRRLARLPRPQVGLTVHVFPLGQALNKLKETLS